ncbi:MAG: flagellar assembly protein FliH [Thiobacillaceae bacterium]|nr:flagellar assembly protein FliH [Thiobacillaceae bacterium]
MSKVIPKEQLTAYQRWELAPFEEGSAPNGRVRAGNESASAKVVLPTAEEVESLHQEAWRQGHELGLEEGRKAGYAEGMKAAEERMRLLAALVDTLDGARLRQDEEIAREVLALALTVAQQVVRKAIQVKPDLLLEALRDALLTLPVLNGHQKIAVHPDHVELVRDWLVHEHGHLSWKVLADPKLDPGSFRFESSHSELDGSLRARWREITECLGVDDDTWLS